MDDSSLKYCTYLTVYFGNKLPRRYIGSCKIDRVSSGYNGSVKSKKFRSLYAEEQKNNKHLFRTKILSRHVSHEEAILAELALHIKYDVVKSSNYMNMSNASPNGHFGRSMNWIDHPMFGRHHTEESKLKLSSGLKLAYKEGRIISPFVKINHNGESNPFYGKTHSEKTKALMRKPKSKVPKWKCPQCDRTFNSGCLVIHAKHKHGLSKEIIDQYRFDTKPLN